MPETALKSSADPNGDAVGPFNPEDTCLPTPLALFLETPFYEVRKKDRSLFMQANQQQILTMLAYRALEPVLMENGKPKYWKLIKPVARIRMALKAERGRMDAEANHTVEKGANGYQHVDRRCAAYGRVAA